MRLSLWQEPPCCEDAVSVIDLPLELQERISAEAFQMHTKDTPYNAEPLCIARITGRAC